MNQLGESESQGLPPLERQVGESSSSDGMMPTRVFGDLEIENDLASRCSSTVANLNSIKAVFSVVMGSNAEVTHGIDNRDFGFTDDMVVSSATTVIKSPILKDVSLILCQHPWVVQN